MSRSDAPDGKTHTRGGAQQPVPVSARVGPFRGYLDYIAACTFLTKRLVRADSAVVDASGALLLPLLEVQLPMEVREVYERFTLSGLDLMRDMPAHPLWPAGLVSSVESTFIRGLHGTSSMADNVVPGSWMDAMLRKFAAGRFAERIADADRRRHMTGRMLEKNRAADMAKHGVQRCGLASCGAAETHPREFKRCSACNHASAAYCCKEHQATHWVEGHKKACKALRPQAAPARDAA
jgi:hypothetical protein